MVFTSSTDHLRKSNAKKYDSTVERHLDGIVGEIEARLPDSDRVYTAEEALAIARFAAQAGILLEAGGIEAWEAVRLANSEIVATGGPDNNPSPRPIL